MRRPRRRCEEVGSKMDYFTILPHLLMGIWLAQSTIIFLQGNRRDVDKAISWGTTVHGCMVEVIFNVAAFRRVHASYMQAGVRVVVRG